MNKKLKRKGLAISAGFGAFYLTAAGLAMIQPKVYKGKFQFIYASLAIGMAVSVGINAYDEVNYYIKDYDSRVDKEAY